MVPILKIVLPFLVIILCSYGCGESTDASIKLSGQQPEIGINLDSIIDFENSKNEWKRSNIYLHSRIKSDDESQFEQYPLVERVGSKSNSFVLHYQWKPGEFISHHDMFIEVTDSLKIELDKTYQIPNDNIKFRIVFYGMGSNFELFKNVRGTIRFSSLQDNYAKIDLDLIGDLSQMIKKDDAKIYKGELNILKDYSCYKGYSPENKLHINLDSIRKLESAKNNDWNGTDIVARAKVTTQILKDTGPRIFYEIDSSLINSFVLINSWRPTGGYNSGIYIEIFNTSKIKLGEEYTIPNDLFDVHAIVHGHMHGADLYENLHGIIQFNRLHEDYTEAKILLKGDKVRNQRSNGELIIDGKLYLLKDFVWQREY